jgi:D-alanyl-D-alanine carboxypeptidase
VIIGKNTIVIFCAALTVIGIAAGLKWQIENSKAVYKSNDVIVDAYKPYVKSNDNALVPAPLDRVEVESYNRVSNQQGAASITAKAYLIGNVVTGEIYQEFNAKQSLPVASMSKLVTAMAATAEMASTSMISIIPNEPSLWDASSTLSVGEKYSLNDILYPLLLSSSNLAAESIAAFSYRDTYRELATSTIRSYFLTLMSSYAWEIGMPSSFFADPSGLIETNIASAEDMFALAKYLYKYRPDILTITRKPQISLATTTEHGSSTFVSTHPFVNDKRFVGGKTGRTLAAGETMLTILDINGQKVAFIILGSGFGNRALDTRKLIEIYTRGQ